MTLDIKLTDYIRISTLLVLLLVSTYSVSAAENNKDLKLDFSIIEEEVETTISEDDEGLSINTNCKKYSENAYTYLYQRDRDNWTSYEAIVLEVDNESNKPQSINLQIEDTYKGKFNLKEDGIILLENSDTKSYRQGKLVYSNLEIPEKFKGKVYIYFDNFINKENNNVLTKKNLEKITSWGITLIPSNEGENTITLNKAELLKKGALSALDKLDNIKIIGSSKVHIPMVGESIENYKVESEENIKLSLLKNYEGVNLSKDGRLTINDFANAQDIILKININDEIEYEKAITLTHSWSFNQVDEDGVPYGLLPPDKSPTVNGVDNLMFLEKSMTFVKIFLVVACFMCTILYVYWKREKIKQHRKGC